MAIDWLLASSVSTNREGGSRDSLRRPGSIRIKMLSPRVKLVAITTFPETRYEIPLSFRSLLSVPNSGICFLYTKCINLAHNEVPSAQSHVSFPKLLDGCISFP